MSDLSRRSPGPPSRKQREQRAFLLTMATGAFSLATVVLFLLAVAGVGSLGLVVLFAVLAVACGFGLKRTMGR